MNRPLFGPQVKYNSTDAQRQNMLAQQLLREGVNTSPVQGGWGEALARIGTAGIGGYLQNQGGETEKKYNADRAQTLARALSMGQDQTNLPGPNPDGSAGYNRPADPNAMAAILMGNPSTADMGAQMAINSIQRQQELSNALAKMKSEYGMKLEYDPKIAGATAEAKVPAALTQREGEAAIDLKYKPQIAGAEAAAQNPALIARAAGQAAATLPYDVQKMQEQGKVNVANAGPIASAQNEARLKAENAPVTLQTPQGPVEVPAGAAADIAKNNAPNASKGFDRANTLRDEYNTLTKDFRTVTDAYSKIKGAASTGAGDMAMLYNFVKLLDPGSVVRESEFATAAASGSYGERIQGMVQRVLTGQRLPDSLRADFMREADNVYKSQQGGAEKLKTQYTDLANRFGLKPEDVIVEYGATQSPTEDDPLGLRK